MMLIYHKRCRPLWKATAAYCSSILLFQIPSIYSLSAYPFTRFEYTKSHQQQWMKPRFYHSTYKKDCRSNRSKRESSKQRSRLFYTFIPNVLFNYQSKETIQMFSTTNSDQNECTSTESIQEVDTGKDKIKQNEKSFLSSYATTYHAPVMARECIEAMLMLPIPTKNGNHNKDKKNKQFKNNRRKKDKYNDIPETAPDDIDTDEVNVNQESAFNAIKNHERKSSLILVDGTLGGGGHSKALLEQMRPGDILIGCDVDPDALKAASERLSQFLLPTSHSKNDDYIPNHPIFIPVQSNFRNLHKVIPNISHPYIPNKSIICPQPESIINESNKEESIKNKNRNGGVDAILMDLGVSSFQIDNADRGFAFLKEGPLDMRMMNSNQNNSTTLANGIQISQSTTSFTAADICNEFDEEELIRILRQYGDEPRAKSIANSIIQNRPLTTTSDLCNAVAQVTPEFARKGRRMGRTATLARVFQALRIVVNQEDFALKEALEDMASNLITKAGGRLVVLSYHSMEDRMVKRIMKDGTLDTKRNRNVSNRLEERDIYGNQIGKGKPWKMLGKGRKATEEEVKLNSRARSATLRVAERLQEKE